MYDLPHNIYDLQDIQEHRYQKRYQEEVQHIDMELFHQYNNMEYCDPHTF
jgi:hypothetical protein